MSVQQTHFVICGIKFENLRDILSEEDSENGKYDDIMEGTYPKKEHKPGDIVMVADFMGSGYLVVGMLIAKGDEFGLPMTNIGSKDWYEITATVERIHDRYPEIVDKYHSLRAEFEASLRGTSDAVKKPMANMGIWVFTNHS